MALVILHHSVPAIITEEATRKEKRWAATGRLGPLSEEEEGRGAARGKLWRRGEQCHQSGGVTPHSRE